MKKIDKERKTIVEPLHEDIDGQEFDVVVAAVNKAKEAHKYDRIWFEVASHDDTDIVGERKESDDEYEKRIGAIKKKEKAIRQKKKDKEIAQLKELAKKYPGEIG